MEAVQLLQSANAVGAIALIMIGSAWLKKYLRQFAVSF